jgi:hypothetical protein
VTITITVPMPETAKGGNSRVHWKLRAELRRSAHYAGTILARAALAGRSSPFQKGEPLAAVIVFRPKSRVCPDLDNSLSGVKGEIDGLCSVLGVDDRQIQHMELRRDYEPKTGDVVITLTQGKE